MEIRHINLHAFEVQNALKNDAIQIRRVIKSQPCDWVESIYYDKETKLCVFRGIEDGVKTLTCNFPGQPSIKCPYGQVGDRLWVKETWGCIEGTIRGHDSGRCTVYYKNDRTHKIFPAWGKAQKMDGKFIKWRSPLFMPRWASRITLEITDIRVERLWEISEKDAMREGFKAILNKLIGERESAIQQLIILWNSLAKKGFKWSDNPWLWVKSLKRIKL